MPLMKTPPVYKSRAILRARSTSSCPKVATQSELAGIRRLNSRFDIGNASDCRNRAEGFIIEGRHALGDPAQYGGRVEGSWSVKWSSPAENAGAFRNASLHLLVERVTQVDTGHRSHIGCRVHWITDAQCFCALQK